MTHFVPFNHATAVTDAIVSGVSRSLGAEVLVLDALMFARGGAASPLGPGKSSNLHELIGT